MRKQFLLTLMISFLAVSAWGTDVSVTERFSLVENQGAKSKAWKGDLCDWNAVYVRRKGDSITVNSEKYKACLLSYQKDVRDSKLQTTTLEGGIKSVSFDYARSGRNNTEGNILNLTITAGTSHTVTHPGETLTASSSERYSHDFNCTTNTQLTIANTSVENTPNESMTDHLWSKILIHDITITPYILYRPHNKFVSLGVKQKGFINPIIDNTGGTITYTSSNTDVATINAEGEITPLTAGTTTITASWKGCSTTYTLTIIGGEDDVVVENFSQVGAVMKQLGSQTIWDGDLLQWLVRYVRRSYIDSLTNVTPRQLGTWFPNDGNTAYIQSKENVEGGVKHLRFVARQMGVATNDVVIKAYYASSGGSWGSAVASDSKTPEEGQEYVFDENISSDGSKANPRLKISNESSFTTGDKAARLIIPNLQITPWLLYTDKNKVWNRGIDESDTYTNEDFINNTGGTVVYESSDEDIATVVGGVVSASKGGNVTITASWNQLSTSYNLHIIAKTTASFEKDAIKITYGDNFSNTFDWTSDYDGTIVYESSNPSVATVDDEGNVTLKGAGETTITATFPATDNYSAAQASYTLIVLPNDRHVETFDNITTATANYANSVTRTGSTGNVWTAILGGFNPGVEKNTSVDHNCARFKAPYTDVETIPSITSATISGGISKLSFKCQAGGNESTTSWDIRIFVNDDPIDTLTDCPTIDTEGWKTYTIDNINVAGDFILKFENHSIISGSYTSSDNTNKGRLLIDDIEWVGLTALADNADNSTTISDIDNEVHSVQLAYRTIRTGGYNTLCLPFAVSAEKLQAALPGAKAFEFTNAYLSESNLDIRFNKVEALEAGKPYLVTVPADVENPVFESVTIDNSDEAKDKNIIVGENMRFIGSYSAGTMEETGLYVVANSLYRVSNIQNEENKTIGACRAYFDVLSGAPAVPRNVRMRIIAGTNTATDVETVDSQKSTVESRKILRDGQVIIIRNGKKYNAMGQLVQ